MVIQIAIEVPFVLWCGWEMWCRCDHFGLDGERQHHTLSTDMNKTRRHRKQPRHSAARTDGVSLVDARRPLTPHSSAMTGGRAWLFCSIKWSKMAHQDCAVFPGSCCCQNEECSGCDVPGRKIDFTNSKNLGLCCDGPWRSSRLLAFLFIFCPFFFWHKKKSKI